MTTCPVCCVSKLGKTSVCCGRCHYNSCRKCFQTFLLSSNSPAPHCMNCRVEFTREFISSNTTQTFANTTLRNHQLEMSLQHEKSLLPTTQAIIQRNRQQVADLEKKIHDIFAELDVLNKQFSSLNLEKRQNDLIQIEEEEKWREYQNKERTKRSEQQGKKRTTTEKQERKQRSEQRNQQRIKHRRDKFDISQKVDTINRKRGQLWHQRTQLTNQINVIRSSLTDRLRSGNVLESETKKCPVVECKGYFNEVTNKCGLCETVICDKCNIPLQGMSTGHICDPSLVATMSLISHQTRKCPKCSVPISKIDGCDQMWCVNCKTGFSWKTGVINPSRRIHNPHFFEWQQQRGVHTPLPNPARLDDIFLNFPVSEREEKYGLIRKSYIKTEDFERFVDDHIFDEDDFLDVKSSLRVQYLVHNMSDEVWKRKLKMRMMK